MGLIKIADIKYPEKLKQIYCPPKQLYFEGNVDLLNETIIAIIGARNCTIYGKESTKYFSSNLSKNNIVIISGLAKGIDAVAHTSCLNVGGKTIAVLGGGLDIIYPTENKYIYDEILKKDGLIISEYNYGIKPEKTHFPARNRIISGLSDGIIVVEAKEKSGTLITVDFALEQGKEVFIVPGNINSACSKGTNKLIQQGARLITDVKDVLEEINYKNG